MPAKQTYLKALTTALALLLASHTLAPEAKAASAAELQTAAESLYKQGEYEESLKYFEALYKAKPSPQLKQFIDGLKGYVNKAKPAGSQTPAKSATPSPAKSQDGKSAAAPKETEARGPKKSLGATLGLALLPGCGHYYLGKPVKGGIYTALTGGLFVMALMGKSKADDLYADYLALPEGSTGQEFDQAYLAYDNKREKANYMLMAAGGAYLLSIMDAVNTYNNWELEWRMSAQTPGTPLLVAKVGF